MIGVEFRDCSGWLFKWRRLNCCCCIFVLCIVLLLTPACFLPTAANAVLVMILQTCKKSARPNDWNIWYLYKYRYSTLWWPNDMAVEVYCGALIWPMQNRHRDQKAHFCLASIAPSTSLIFCSRRDFKQTLLVASIFPSSHPESWFEWHVIASRRILQTNVPRMVPALKQKGLSSPMRTQ